MEETITVTKSEINAMVESLVAKKLNNGDKDDILSPNYNAGRLFNHPSKAFRKQLVTIQKNYGMLREEPYGIVIETRPEEIHDALRKLVLLNFRATTNNEIPIALRQKAVVCYKRLSEQYLEWFEMFSRLRYKEKNR